MTDWAARAKAHFSHKGQDASDKSDKRGVWSLLSPPISPLCENALSAKHPNTAANDSQPDPDRWCWPNSTAMTGREINTFTARLSRFTGRGLDVAHAEALADKLVNRDREKDDRHACPECQHLQGYGAASWRCGNWQAAGVASRTRDAQLPGDLVHLLQRCDGFPQAIHSHFAGDHHGQT